VRFLTFIEIVILLGALTLFVLQNPNSLTLFVNYATKELGLSYESVSGNLLKTVTLNNVSYEGRLLTKEASIDWNLKALLGAKLKIDEITIKKLDIPLTQRWISDLSRKFSDKKRSGGFEDIPTIEISQIIFSALPFESEDISVKRIELQANDIIGDLSGVDIGFFSFLTQSDIADITSLGKMKNGSLVFEKLWLEKIDVHKLISFLKNKNKKKRKREIKQKFVKEFEVDELIVYTLPVSFRKYKIQDGSLTVKHLYSKDLSNFGAKAVFIDCVTNMWTLSSSGYLKNNRLYTKVDLKLKDKYFKRFVPFFDHEKIKPINVDLQVDTNGLNANLHAKADKLLISKYAFLKASIPKLKSHIDFDFKTLQMRADVKATLNSIYAKDANLSGRLYYDKEGGFRYDGEVRVKELDELNKRAAKLLKNARIEFEGNVTKIKANLNSDHLTGIYDGKSYKKASLHLRSKTLTPKILSFENIDAIKDLKMIFDAKIAINFKKLLPAQINYGIKSNLIDLNATALVSDKITTFAILKKSKKSLLNKLYPNLKQNSLFPANIDVIFKNKNAFIDFKSRYLKIKTDYDLNTSECNLSAKIGRQIVNLTGNIKKECALLIDTPSVREFQDDISKLYKFEKIPIDADLKVNMKINDLKKIRLIVDGKWFVYEYKPNRFLFAEKFKIASSYKNKRLTIDNYRLTTYLDRERLFFANSPSKFIFDKQQIKIDSFLINDAAKISGYYNYIRRNAILKLFTKNYHYDDLEGDFYFDAAINLFLSKKGTNIDGSVTINGGTISYEPKKEHDVQDKDIIIIQERKHASKQSDTLSLDISILTKKPIYYKIQNTAVKFTADLKLWKEIHKKIELLGMVKLINGTHSQGGKEFEIQPGEILFGGSVLNPYLNISAIHISDPYKIHIDINGQLDAPIINFNSTPYLTQSDILSILLFNSTTQQLIGGNQDSSKTAISMFGTIFAKEIVQNFGIKLDKLVLTTTQEGKLGVELGKKISKKVTLIYINDIVQTIKIRYKLSDHFESDFVFSPDNSGIDIIFKDEY